MDNPEGPWFSPTSILQVKELIALLTLVWLLVHTYRSVIPKMQSEFVNELKTVLTKLDETLDRLTQEVRSGRSK